jgi:putative sterol carrier protein
MTVPAPARVRVDPAATSGLADMVRQLLEQNLGESEARRRRARSLTGTIVLNASDYGSVVTVAFVGGEITISDGAEASADASISGPYATLVDLLQGDTHPLAEHLRGRIRVRSSLRRPFFPLRVQSLMTVKPEPAFGRRWIVALAALGLVAGVAAFALVRNSGG